MHDMSSLQYRNQHVSSTQKQPQLHGNTILLHPTPATTIGNGSTHSANPIPCPTRLFKCLIQNATRRFTTFPIVGFGRPRRDHMMQRYKWYFRPLGSASIAKFQKDKDGLVWIPFEQKNQRLLEEQHHRFMQAFLEDTCKIQDKSVLGGRVSMDVMLRERVAFVLDPEWSEPMVLEIRCLPKLTFCQRLQVQKERWREKRSNARQESKK